jgi:type 1 glutamine amidotransferase
MARSVFIVWDDKYHPKSIYTPMVDSVFDGGAWEVCASSSARDLLGAAKQPDLAVFLSAGISEGEEPLSGSEQEALCVMVEAGMGIIYIHAGLTRILPDTPMFGLSRGYFIMHPEGNPPVRCCALPDAAHPAAEGIAAFEEPDEHYFCVVDVERTQPFLCSRSPAGTEIAGWAHTRGGGRVCCLTPGHTGQMLEAMAPVIENAVKWCVRNK